MNYGTTTTDSKLVTAEPITKTIEAETITLSGACTTSSIIIDATEEKCSNCSHTDVCQYKKHLEKLVGKHNIEITDIKDAVPEEAADSLSCSVEIKCKHYDKLTLPHYTAPIYTTPYTTPYPTVDFPVDPYKITCGALTNSVSKTAGVVEIKDNHAV